MHLASFWKWGFLELGSSPLWSRNNYYFNKSDFWSRSRGSRVLCRGSIFYILIFFSRILSEWGAPDTHKSLVFISADSECWQMRCNNGVLPKVDGFFLLPQLLWFTPNHDITNVYWVHVYSKHQQQIPWKSWNVSTIKLIISLNSGRDFQDRRNNSWTNHFQVAVLLTKCALFS